MTATLEDIATEVYDQWGTLNTAADPTKIDKSHTPRAINVWPDEKPGSLVTVNGMAHVGDLPSGNPCRFLYTFSKSDGSAIVLCSDNGTVYKTSDFITFTSIITGLASSYQLRAITVRDKAWLTNGSDNVRTYDGTSVVSLSGSGGTTPTVPKGKFIALWHERVWLGDIPSHRSSLRFSALTDSSGTDIAPDDVSAWPTINEIAFGQDDGDVVCGIKVFATVMHAFKEASIWRIDGSDEFSYQPTRTTATTGCRVADSIQERDNLLEFIGKDGIYEFDGARTTKVSQAIESVDLSQFSFSNIQQGSNQQLSRDWNLQSDFTAGTLTGVSATRIDGSLIIDGYTYDGTSLPVSSSPVWTKSTNRTTNESVSGGKLSMSCVGGTTAGTNTAELQYSRVETLSNANGTRLKASVKLTSSGTGGFFSMAIRDGTKAIAIQVYPTAGIFVKDDLFGSTITSYAMAANDAFHTYDLVLVGNTYTLYIDGVSRASGTPGTTSTQAIYFGVDYLATTGVTASADLDYITVLLNQSGTAEAISDVYHITDTIATWGVFDANYVSNGGSIAFYVRSGTSSVNCLADTWASISPGATISFATSHVYVQWRAVFTASGTDSPELEDVSIGWNTSSGTVATTQPVASIVYNNRYILSGALSDSSYNNVVIVRGKRVYNTPWVRLSGFNIVAFCIYNKQLYAADSNSDDICRFDDNNNIKGAALDSTWETRDEVGNVDEIFYKRWPMVIISGIYKGNYSLTVDISIDGGLTFPAGYQKTVSLSGTGRFVSELHYPDLRGKQIRVRVRTNGIDTPFEVSSIRVFWRKKFLR